MNLIEVDEARFRHEVLEAEKPVLVQFWAPWCKSCRAMEPIIDELAAEAGDQFLVTKVDVEENRELAFHEHIRGVPTLKLYKQGAEAAKIVGVRTKEQLEDWLTRNLSGS